MQSLVESNRRRQIGGRNPRGIPQLVWSQTRWHFDLHDIELAAACNPVEHPDRFIVPRLALEANPVAVASRAGLEAFLQPRARLGKRSAQRIARKEHACARREASWMPSRQPKPRAEGVSPMAALPVVESRRREAEAPFSNRAEA